MATSDSKHAALTLVLGGTRSGKSEIAEQRIGQLAGPGNAVTYVATGAEPEAGADAAWAARVRVHRERRPPNWSTVDLPAGADLGGALRDLDGPVILDSLGTWVAGFERFDCDADRFCADCSARSRAGRGPLVIVSEEVGLGVHPSTEVGMAFADALGSLNRKVAAAADDVWLVVAGRVLAFPASWTV